jgi:hypothetical protein
LSSTRDNLQENRKGTIRFSIDNNVQRTRLRKVRRYIPPSVGDVVEVKVKGHEDHYDGGTILHANGGGFYYVEVDGEVRKDLHENSFHQT